MPGHRYRNGNCEVEMDRTTGTKIRSWVGDPLPELPESIDLKITDHCDAGCPWCHEKSTKRGAHGDTQWILGLVRQCMPWSELAIGGGNPLDHPSLKTIIACANDIRVIPNLTVNAVHEDQLDSMIFSMPPIGAVGFSASEEKAPTPYVRIPSVLHCIAGITPVTEARRWVNFRENGGVLVLGCKDHGFGSRYLRQHNPAIEENMRQWRWQLPILMSNARVSFDNLALEQLQVRELVGEELWAERYMGDEGHFTMYIDAVRREYAISSTSPRKPCGSLSLREMFADVRAQAGAEAAAAR